MYRFQIRVGKLTSELPSVEIKTLSREFSRIRGNNQVSLKKLNEGFSPITPGVHFS